MSRKRFHTHEAPAETVLLVGAAIGRGQSDLAADSLQELAQLVSTAGGVVCGRVMQLLAHPNPATYIGSGKVEEIRSTIAENGITTVVFDDELSPNQVRNLEGVLKCKLVDRSQLILDIFARRAKTATAKTQVELAQLEYLRTRLTRQWTHLSRQQGGIGTRGPGETQIETDRRLIGRRMATLKSRLRKIDAQRALQRKGRARHYRVSLVGYTNAGKSTLMNALAGSRVPAEDQLFATLDSTTRQVGLPSGLCVLLSDTVGFIRKLPHKLIESFKSTLDEVRHSDVLLHVVDLSHRNYEDHMRVVRQTLFEIGALELPTILVFNKIDAAGEPVPAVQQDYPEGAFVSALRGIGLEMLCQQLDLMLRRDQVEEVACVPVYDGRTLARIRQYSDVLEETLVEASDNGAPPIAAMRVKFRAEASRRTELETALARYLDLHPLD
ncbi:MAG: GTPase HflX [Bacteroidota bacterium]|nr:GTPase HflX [Bacteroidota bacterium]MDE2833430.1 GTPase HflX [Bacteroidota bacterium]